MQRIAFDIETVSPDVPHTDRPTFDDPTDFEFLVSGLGYQEAPGEDIETELIFRDGWGAVSELDVIEATLDWLDDRDADQLVTYNGTNFDLVHLRGRAEIACNAAGERAGLVERIDAFVDGVEHIDLRNDAVSAYGGYPTFEDVCSKNDVGTEKTLLEDHGISVDALNKYRDSASWGDAHIGNGDVPVIGERFLDGIDEGKTSAVETYREALEHYSRADIVPLFDLADKRPFAEAPV